eukprot:TRINITY_DN9814_c0_g1_i1.p1 TRINITY_DN9814_c0_g1~~TRINITY_DN9814_c0_g1_i1.p1  ORF type:complete len:103 (-),score=9.80 TRINITY_DN9814_c0_g1_i1:133-441(-)
MIIIAGIYGKRMVDDSHDTTNTTSPPQNTTSNSLSSKDQNTVIGILTASAAVAAVFGAIWLQIMKRCADSLIKVSMVISCTFLAIAAIASFAAGIVVMGTLI